MRLNQIKNRQAYRKVFHCLFARNKGKRKINKEGLRRKRRERKNALATGDKYMIQEKARYRKINEGRPIHITSERGEAINKKKLMMERATHP